MPFVLNSGSASGLLNLNVAGAFSGYPWQDSDGLAWYQKVKAAGADISQANQPVFDTFFQALKSGSIWNTIGIAGIFQGFIDGTGGSGSAWKGCFVPLKNTANSTLVNNSFSPSDYNGLLTVNSLGQYIDLGVNCSGLGISGGNAHAFVVINNDATGGYFGNGGIGGGSLYYATDIFNQFNFGLFQDTPFPVTLQDNTLEGGTRWGYTNYKSLYFPDDNSIDSDANTAPLSGNITLFKNGISYAAPSFQMQYYSFGTTIGGNQSACETNYSNYSTAVNKLLSNLTQ
jgi:hypothetical protein